MHYIKKKPNQNRFDEILMELSLNLKNIKLYKNNTQN